MTNRSPIPPPPVPARRPDGRWDLRAARAWQERLRTEVSAEDDHGPVRLVAGVDVSYDRRDPTVYAAVVVWDVRTGEVAEVAARVERASFPYVPGYLAFREAPPVLGAFRRLHSRPDLVLADGHGQAHPRGAGIACHLGVLLDLPAVGVAKTILVGHAGDLGPLRGARAPLVWRGTRIGTALRTRDGIAPVYVSVGHRVSIASASRLVLRAGNGYRLPEPVRLAHLEVNALRRGERDETVRG